MFIKIKVIWIHNVYSCINNISKLSIDYPSNYRKRVQEVKNLFTYQLHVFNIYFKR